MSMPLLTYSSARLLEKCCTKALLAAYTDMQGSAEVDPATEDTFTIAPLPRASMLGSTPCVAFTIAAQLLSLIHI